MSQSNPLQKYFRQPKLYISLPSKGLYYASGSFQGDYNHVPIFAMTGMDEILMKTPDALFNGEATTKVIESCCPYIKDAKSIPSLDIDALLIAIRMATFGESMAVAHTCTNCGEEHDYEVKLPTILDQYQSKEFDNKLIIDDFTISLRPLTYHEMSTFDMNNFKLQKILSQVADANPEEQQKYLDEVYQSLAESQRDLFVTCIDSVQTPDTLVTDKEFIKEWISNTTSEVYKMIKHKLELNKDRWSVPQFSVDCSNCGHKNSFDVVMDQSNFFA